MKKTIKLPETEYIIGDILYINKGSRIYKVELLLIQYIVNEDKDKIEIHWSDYYFSGDIHFSYMTTYISRENQNHIFKTKEEAEEQMRKSYNIEFIDTTLENEKLKKENQK